jgi:hypothetical protein
MSTELERRAIAAWQVQPWGLHTTCTGCGRFTYCRGKTRARVLCLPCFDLGPS